MRCLTTVLVLASLILGAPLNGQADWTGAASIRAESFYVPSTGLTVGAWTTVHAGTENELSGYAITNDLQINLEYQAGILDKDIANLNTYMFPANAAFPADHTDGTWTTNFSDNEEYLLNVNAAGTGLTVYTYPGPGNEVFDADIDWTISGWHQTILAGDIVDNGDGTISLRVLPTGTYRPFPNDPPVNNVEIFSGLVSTEVLGYTFIGTAGSIGSGSSLGVMRVPEPNTLVLLITAGLGALGYVWRRRRI